MSLVTWHGLLTELQPSPVMVASGTSARVSWGFSSGDSNATQVARRLSLYRENGTLVWSDSTRGTAQHAVLRVPLLEACTFFWTVCVDTATINSCSPKQTIFTAPAAFKSPPFWAPKNSTVGSGPQFAFFRTTLTLPAARLASALLFVTADGPGCNNSADLANRKLLGGYKMWLGDALIGIGPGRSKCDTLGAARAPALCPLGVETIFDGYDLTDKLGACAVRDSGRCRLFIEAYGFDQPQWNISRRVLVDLRLRLSNGSALAPLEDLNAWESYDADQVYLARLWAAGFGGHSTSQNQSSGGGTWYYAPHEYIDTGAIPEDTPLWYDGAGKRAHGLWQRPVRKKDFPNLVVRGTPPVEVTLAAARVTRKSVGHFAFQLAREVQGGIVLDAGALSAPCNATVAQTLQPNPRHGSLGAMHNTTAHPNPNPHPKPGRAW